MVHITLSIPEEVYKEMKKHPEIKWSEVARVSIIEKTKLLKKRMSGSEFFSLLPEKTKEHIKYVPGEEWKEFSKKVKKESWKRAKSLTQA